MTNLKWLYLDNNKISDIRALKSLTNLESLRISNNPISDLSLLKELPNLKFLNLDDDSRTRGQTPCPIAIREQSQKNTVKKEGSSWTIINDDIFVSTGSYEMVNLTLVTSGNEATLIDTGYDTIEAEAIKKFIENNNLTLKNIILTHGHDDHDAQLDMFINDNVNLYKYDNSEDNQVIEMGNKKLKIIFTPGHCDDKHMSVEVNKEILVAGDIITSSISPLVVLNHGGNAETLTKTLENLKEKNYSLIIPGHGDLCISDSIINDHLLTLKGANNEN